MKILWVRRMRIRVVASNASIREVLRITLREWGETNASESIRILVSRAVRYLRGFAPPRIAAFPLCRELFMVKRNSEAEEVYDTAFRDEIRLFPILGKVCEEFEALLTFYQNIIIESVHILELFCQCKISLWEVILEFFIRLKNLSISFL